MPCLLSHWPNARRGDVSGYNVCYVWSIHSTANSISGETEVIPITVIPIFAIKINLTHSTLKTYPERFYSHLKGLYMIKEMITLNFHAGVLNNFI